MAYKCTQFISQNTSPVGTKRIGIYNAEGERVFRIPLNGLAPVKKEKLYSFGLVSDTHMGYNKASGIGSYADPNDPMTVGLRSDDGNGIGVPPNGTLFRKAMDFMSQQGIDFLCNCGDLTNIGFYWERGDSEMFVKQFGEYRDLCALYPHISVYNVMGNHESYNANIVDTLNEMEEYTGTRKITYYFECGNDVFIIVGQSSNTKPMTDEHLQWLMDRLDEFKHRRCFIFIHSFLRNDSGAPCNARDNDIFSMTWGTAKTENFKKMLSDYPNIILFHGHSHMKFESQQYDKNANYTEKNGFQSVHVPSLGDPRTLLDTTGKWETDRYGGQFYIVDVYDDCIVLNGYYVFKNTEDDVFHVIPIMIGTYKIETKVTNNVP